MYYFEYILLFSIVCYYLYNYTYKSASISRIILITGATDGIGNAFVYKYASMPNIEKIYITGRNLDKLTIIKDEIYTTFNKTVIPIVCDLSKQLDLDIFKSAKNDIDTYIYCAGLSYPNALKSHSVDTQLSNDIITVNCTSATILTNYLLDSCNIKNILLVGSGNALIKTGVPFYSVYAGSKLYLEQYCKSIASEYTQLNIQIHHPYMVCSKMSKVKRPSLFTPTSGAYVNSSYTQFIRVNSANVSRIPYMYHYLQHIVLSILPSIITSRVIYNMNHRLFIRAIKNIGK